MKHQIDLSFKYCNLCQGSGIFYQVTDSKIVLFLCCLLCIPRLIWGPEGYLSHIVFTFFFFKTIFLPLSVLFTFISANSFLVSFSNSHFSLHFTQNMKYKSHNVYCIGLGIVITGHLEPEDLYELFTE